MRDEHLIYTDTGNDKIKVIPAEGYRMFCKRTKDFMSEAVITERDIKWFVSVFV